MVSISEDPWTAVIEDWLTTGAINTVACGLAYRTYPKTQLGKTLRCLAVTEFARGIGYTIQAIFFRNVDPRLVNAISSSTYGSLWGVTDILCIHYSWQKLSVIAPSMQHQIILAIFYTLYVLIWLTHPSITVFELIRYYTSSEAGDDNIFKLVKFTFIFILDSILTSRIVYEIYLRLNKNTETFRQQDEFEKNYMIISLIRIIFGGLLYMSLTICYFITGQFPSITQSVFMVDQIKRILPTLLVIDFLLTKVETEETFYHQRDHTVNMITTGLRTV
jgi:uncharacterized membrane protein